MAGPAPLGCTLQLGRETGLTQLRQPTLASYNVSKGASVNYITFLQLLWKKVLYMQYAVKQQPPLTKFLFALGILARYRAKNESE